MKLTEQQKRKREAINCQRSLSMMAYLKKHPRPKIKRFADLPTEQQREILRLLKAFVSAYKGGRMNQKMR